MLRRLVLGCVAVGLAVAGSAGVAGAASAAAPAATYRCAFGHYVNFNDASTGAHYYLLMPVDDLEGPLCLLKPGEEDNRTYHPIQTAIHELQRSLNICYGEHLSIDGDYGSATEAAVARTQRKEGLPADGVYGPQSAMYFKFRLYDGNRNYLNRCFRLHDV